MATLNIRNFPDRLYRTVKKLAEVEDRSIAQQVIHLLAQAVHKPEPESILSLRGLGKEAWRGIKAEDHVANERKSWD